jgi:hypothetical protein
MPIMSTKIKIIPKSMKLLMPLTFLFCIAQSPSSSPIPGADHAKYGKSASEQDKTNRDEKDQRRPRPPVSVVPMITPDRAAQERAAAESAKRASEQEAHYRRQEELATGTLAVTQRTLDIDSELVTLTTVLAIVNFLTMLVFYVTMRANVKAANAADVSAKAAKASADAALRSDRPVLVAEKFIPHNIYPREGLPESERTTVVGFWIRNCGKGPALSVELAGLLTLKNELPYPASIGACRPIAIRDTVIPSGGDLEVRALYLLNEVESAIAQNEINAIESGQIKLFIYGIVHYRDIHRGRYTTWFGCEYRPTSFGAKMGFFPNPPEYNRHYEYGPD